MSTIIGSFWQLFACPPVFPLFTNAVMLETEWIYDWSTLLVNCSFYKYEIFLVLPGTLRLKFYFAWYECCYTCFLFLSISLENAFIFPFCFSCVSYKKHIVEVSFFILFCFVLDQSENLCFLIKEFNPFILSWKLVIVLVSSVLFYYFLFIIVSYIQNTCKNSPKDANILFTQIHPLLIFCHILDHSLSWKYTHTYVICMYYILHSYIYIVIFHFWTIWEYIGKIISLYISLYSSVWVF